MFLDITITEQWIQFTSNRIFKNPRILFVHLSVKGMTSPNNSEIKVGEITNDKDDYDIQYVFKFFIHGILIVMGRLAIVSGHRRPLGSKSKDDYAFRLMHFQEYSLCQYLYNYHALFR